MNINKEILKEALEIIIESWDEIEPIMEQKKIINRDLKERLEILKAGISPDQTPEKEGYSNS